MNRKRLPTALPLLAGAVLATGLLGAIGLWALRPRPAASRPGGTRNDRFATTLIRQPCQISEGIYLLGEMSPSAVYVIDTAEGLAMIDAGLAEQHQSLLDGLTSLGLDAGRLKIILLTHAHGDHSMGAESLRREFGAKIYVGEEDAGPLRDGGPREAIFSKFEMRGAEMHPTTVDGGLVDGQVFNLGDARIRAVATPGHTPGSFCYLLEQHDRRVFFTGDTVMTVGGLGTYAAYLPPVYRGNARDYLASLEKLRAMPAPDLMLPGHPGSDRAPRSPRMNPSRWREMLDRGIDELKQLIERRERDGADFLAGTPQKIDDNLFYLGDLDGHAVYAVMMAGGALLFDAACGELATEFVGSAWQKLGVRPPPTVAVLLTSCQPSNLAGLGAIVEATPCRVVASPTGVTSAKEACGDETLVLSSDELARLGFDGLEAMPLPGRDETAVAYQFTLQHKRVLVSGDTPIEGEKAVARRLSEELSPERWDVDRFSESLEALAGLKPDVWLSAHPLFGRSANLYDDDWLHTISLNRDLLRQHPVAE
ncbi:MAG TPA: MBL fold metallo-hydrolase [Pirellulales bacterium]|nr:MBL fold metallo-hydrolase [Pirellulales bacterium]